MGKQSSRLYYRGKDHKDIYFQEKYHNAMVVCKEGDEKLVWRKLYDEKYYIYQWWIYSYYYGYSWYYSVLYPKYKIREFIDWGFFGLYEGKYNVHRLASGTSAFYISKDGKLIKSIDRKQFNTDYIRPKWDGVVMAVIIDSSNQEYEWTYYPIKNGNLDVENAHKIYSDTEHETKTNINVSLLYNYGIHDLLVITSDGLKLTAVDMDGGVHDMVTLSSMVDNKQQGYFKGMYWIVDQEKTSGSYPYKVIVRTARNPYGEWEKKIINEGRGTYYKVRIITAKDYIVIYRYHSESVPIIAYTTEDFVNLTEIELPENLLIPIIGEKPSDLKDYINIIIKTGKTARDDAHNFYLAKSSVMEKVFPTDKQYSYSSPENMGYVHHIGYENQELCPTDSIMFSIGSSMGCITCYIDNLFFKESDGNFAFCERAYPRKCTNDYMKEEGD